MRRPLILAIAALALAATPAVVLAGGQGAAKDCGSIVVTTAKPSWIRTYSTWKLNDFAPTTGKLISCSTVKQVANTYLSTGKASGYTVMAFKGLKGRNLYKGDPSAKIGFQLFQ
jgi:hypothetical protein